MGKISFWQCQDFKAIETRPQGKSLLFIRVVESETVQKEEDDFWGKNEA